MTPKALFIMAMCLSVRVAAQQLYTASFVAKLGDDTVIVETYNMVQNHLYGKAFLRYPEDYIGLFDFYFYPNGSIRYYSMAVMKPDSSYISDGIVGVICENDTCTWFAPWPGAKNDGEIKYALKHLDFMGGWTPTLSLIEWNCMRLIKSRLQSLPVTLMNLYIGTRDVAVMKGNKDTLIFGGPFLEYTKITTTPEGRILTYDGTATPWNYIVTKHNPIDVDEVAKRMSKKPKIGIPSPEVKVSFPFEQDTIKLSYGRPAKRGRKIFGGVVPFDSIWSTGAGDPTTIDLPVDIQFGKQVIPKGKYSLYTIPTPTDWTLIFNTDLKQWPTDPNRSKDFAHIIIKSRKPVQQADRFTINIENEKSGGVIIFTWDETEAYAPFRIIKKK
ncbi:MAG TPA: DUF2911 domain-containing protein [Niastella sp.]